jgi:hypothetical protein
MHRHPGLVPGPTKRLKRARLPPAGPRRKAGVTNGDNAHPLSAIVYRSAFGGRFSTRERLEWEKTFHRVLLRRQSPG